MVTEKALSPVLLFREADEMGWLCDLGSGLGSWLSVLSLSPEGDVPPGPRACPQFRTYSLWGFESFVGASSCAVNGI